MTYYKAQQSGKKEELSKVVVSHCFRVTGTWSTQFNVIYLRLTYIDQMQMAANEDPVVMECPVCHENYNEPKILPCAHLLCRNCLVRWMSCREGAKCPLCRSAISDNDVAQSKHEEELADSLPTDIAMSAVVECAEIIASQPACCVHSEVEAVSLCMQCSIVLCQACAEYHKEFPVTSSHSMADLASVTPESVAACRQTLCTAHRDKACELFCFDHGIPICHVCASSKHRACPDVRELRDMIETCRKFFGEMEVKLNSVERSLNEAIKQIDQLTATSEKYTRAAYVEVDRACDHLNVLIEKCRQTLKQRLKDAEDEVQEKKSVLPRQRGNVTSHKLLIRRILQTSSCSTQCAMAATLQNRIQHLNYDVSLPADNKLISIGILTVGREALNRLEEGVEKIGQMDFISVSMDELYFWRFHSVHGKNIVLSDMTAELIGHSNGVVLSSRPMGVNMLYEVRVEEIDSLFDASRSLIGVVSANPSTLTLPEFGSNILSAICINSEYVCVHTEWQRSNLCQALSNIEVGSRIGMVIDTALCLHLYMDGKDQGVVCCDVKEPCYFMIDLIAFIKKVIVLPLTSTW